MTGESDLAAALFPLGAGPQRLALGTAHRTGCGVGGEERRVREQHSGLLRAYVLKRHGVEREREREKRRWKEKVKVSQTER